MTNTKATAAPKPKPPPDAELWTVDELAAFLRTTRKSIYDMVYSGKAPGLVRVGRRVLFRAKDVRKSVGL